MAFKKNITKLLKKKIMKKKNNKGVVIWVTGLSGSGKSFFAKKIKENFDKKKNFIYFN